MTRIIAGSYRGRRLAVPPGDRTRPTTDRVREALFSALASAFGAAAAPPESALAGLAFCDLYAGSGAVGLEAASRGADPVLLVEADRRTAQLARRNAAGLGLAVEVLPGRVEQVLARPAGRAYDVVFADPPYELATEQVEAHLTALRDGGWLAPGGLVVLERARRSRPPAWPAGYADPTERAYGETMLFLASTDA